MLTERQEIILQAIVDHYISTAEPVGSRTVSKAEGIGYSAATIRNEMADLESLGFLEQPHTSAGRIPTHVGYRYYVDHLMEPETPSREEMFFLRELFAIEMGEMEQVIQETASILSSITNYVTIILGPQIVEHKLKHLQLIPLSDKTAVIIIVTNTGHVDKRNISIPVGVSISLIEQMVNFLNQHLHGVPLHRLKETVYKKLTVELSRHIEEYQSVLSLMNHVLATDTRDRMYYSGTTNMLNQPEFQDLNKVKSFLNLFEHQEHQSLVMHLHPLAEQGIQVKIGQENVIAELDQCSLITASYQLHGRVLGTISVLGPTRMDYQKVVGYIDILSKSFSDHLRLLYK
ncbi:heat-inducible transcriptional repressor HrcA [Mechercharimyces sp. CAU 1602]|uniref:heat-inducible transcriptional repressor HrcA n=1 Tax=Mechercharimyces sp. CAU 1602 TaxID=2973933 RepID=UPI0021620165|nr:heat-inducible transcriptional repressor HrcA [Mechercharimyces sp. CAU 1602]MCS1350446.1 heat-inducible transcriptional repressor HrcA [Mechercharimyces sp. CAU 1602]